MDRWTQLTPDEASVVPWRNGRGVTSELAVWPTDASFSRGDFEWRVSLAGVGGDGPFSEFPGFTRSLVLIEGSGLVLDHGDAAGRARLRPLELYTFDGGWPTSAELVDGPVRDFGVMARADRWRVELEALRLGARRARLELDADEHGFLHVPSGTVAARIDGEEEEPVLEAGMSLWIRPSRRGADLELAGADPSALALLVRLTPLGVTGIG